MINKNESEEIKNKFLNSLYDYMNKDKKERNLILTMMVSCFVVALICTAISSIMIYISYEKSVNNENVNQVNIVEGEIQHPRVEGDDGGNRRFTN